jgi:serine/threonine protein kinase
VERLLGRGGMCGGVHEAFDLHSGTRVALKATTDLREFFAARAVEHPNVCRVFECGSEGDPHFLAMELLEGVTLEERLAERGAMGLEEWRAFAAQLCAGLGAIHEAGLIHRDLKPSNIFLTTAGRVVIIDFGLARFVQQGAFEGAGRQSAGTLLYMAPEVLAGKQASVRSDIHSLGVVLEEALTGEAPVDSRGVSEAVRDCLHRNPAMRPGSVAAVTDTICCTREGFEVTSFGMLAALLG